MKIINIIPIKSSVFKETLSYFSAKDIPVGSIVTVDIRKKEVLAIVESVNEAREVKSALRTAGYSIKKIKQVHHFRLFTQAFVNACRQTAEYFTVTTGSIITSLTPSAVIAEKIKEQNKKQNKNPQPSFQNTGTQEVFSLQNNEDDRIASYKSAIREAFARKQSVFLCVPQAADVNIILKKLERGISEYAFGLHGEMTKKEVLSVWEQAENEEHPILIVATWPFLSIPRNDLGVLIIDREGSPNYKTFTRPHFDIRTFALFFAKAANIRLIFGDIMLRTETIKYTLEHSYIEIAPLKFKILSPARQMIVDMREYRKTGSKKKFEVVSDELDNAINTNKTHNENMFIFTARRGLGTITVCNDCEEILTCKRCMTPMTLHKKDAGNIFQCHRCGATHDAHATCSNCGGWRLVALGIGIERVEEEIKKRFPEITLFKIDSDSVKTHKKAAGIAGKFFSSPGSILIGTEMAIPYLHQGVETCAIANMDSLFSIPDFRMNEKMFRLLLLLRSRATKSLIIQTAIPNDRVFVCGASGNSIDFYRKEITQREQFGYPPFRVLIKTTKKAKKAEIPKTEHTLSKIFSTYESYIFHNPIPDRKGLFEVSALLKIKPEEWVDKGLLLLLREMQPEYTVEIDPKSLL